MNHTNTFTDNGNRRCHDRHNLRRGEYLHLDWMGLLLVGYRDSLDLGVHGM